MIIPQKDDTHPGEKLKEELLNCDLDRQSASSLTIASNGNSTIGNTPSRCRHRILCVDDDVMGTQIRGELLEELGYSVVLYNSPSAALNCDLSVFDLGVLDFAMPQLNGRDLLLRMRAAGARFPLILLTGNSNSLCHDDRVLFAECIDKGEPIQRLLDSIARLLDPNQLSDYGVWHYGESSSLPEFNGQARQLKNLSSDPTRNSRSRHAE
jgi:CheY-like chemotaxis protein